MTLVRKACGVRDFGYREFRLCQYRLGSFEPLLYEILVRGDTSRLLKFSRKMMHR